MKSTLVSFSIFVTFAIPSAVWSESPGITISKETTFITEPLREDGYPDYASAINRRYGRGVTAETNANVLFWRAHGPHPEGATMNPRFFKLMGTKSPPNEGVYFDLWNYLTNDGAIPIPNVLFNEIDDRRDKAIKGPWTSDEFPVIASWLAHNAKPLTIVSEAARRPNYYSPLIIESVDGMPGGLAEVLLPAVQKSRSFSRTLAMRAMLRVGEEKTEQAWQDLLTIHRIGRHVGRGPTLVEGLVGLAIDEIAHRGDLQLIRHSKLTPPQAGRYIQDFAALPRLPDITETLDLCERMILLDTVLLLKRGRTDAIDLFGGGAKLRKLEEVDFEAVDWDVALRTGNDWFNRLVKASQRKEWLQCAKDLNAIEAELKEFTAKLSQSTELERITNAKRIAITMFGEMLPEARRALAVRTRALQRQDNLRVALALAAYQGARGRYPAATNELSPQYLKEIPGDRFCGKPLIYHLVGRGYRLYSVGVNGKDDHGRGKDDAAPGDDVSVRLKE